MANGSRRRRRRVQANRKALGDRSDHRPWREHRELDVVPPSFLRLVTGGRPAEQAALVNEKGAGLVGSNHHASRKMRQRVAIGALGLAWTASAGVADAMHVVRRRPRGGAPL